MSNDLLVFDVTADFPVKALNLEEVADIEYLVLDVTDDDYLYSSFHTMTENFILCRGNNEVVFFNRSNGKPVSKVSRFGQGPEEYRMFPYLPVYSEIKDELFFLSMFEIPVYTRDGIFKRKFSQVSNTFSTTAMYDYDDDHLLIHGHSLREGSMRDSAFMLVSKQDGSIADVVQIPVEERFKPAFWQGIVGGLTIVYSYYAVRNGRDFLLTDYSSDTVYRFTPERNLIPVLVRKPSVHTMETKIFLHSWQETGNYLFFSTQKIYVDQNGRGWPPPKGYLMEKSSGKFFQTNIRTNDYKGKEWVLGPSVIQKTPNEKTGIIVLNTLELHTANEENRLSGKLKEVNEHLSEDDEYVFMILKFK